MTSQAAEVPALEIKVTIVEPAGWATDWSGPSAKRAAPIAAYDHIRAARAAAAGEHQAWGSGRQRSRHPQGVDATDLPLRIFLGTVCLPMTKAEYAKRIETREAWNDVSVEAQGDLQKAGRAGIDPWFEKERALLTGRFRRPNSGQGRFPIGSCPFETFSGVFQSGVGQVLIS
jgi:hypothetical protein